MNLKMKKSYIWIASVLLVSCSSNESNFEQDNSNSLMEEAKAIDTAKTVVKIEQPRAGLDQLTDIQTIDKTIQVDLKYATTDNFMHQILYKDIQHLYLQKDVAVRLSKCQQYLKKINPSYSLLIYDGVRPLAVQKAMWDALDTIPFSERTKFVSNPANGSLHNYGAAVDLTICDENGIALDMGAGYDDIREIAYPKFETRFLETGELTVEQIDNRKLLRKVMSSQRFTNIQTEWWHFNACSRATAKIKYEILK
jgi:D-alanyl-D-alanine dipeptidase